MTTCQGVPVPRQHEVITISLRTLAYAIKVSAGRRKGRSVMVTDPKIVWVLGC